MKFAEFAQIGSNLIEWRQNCRPKVKRSISLMKSAARHNTNARVLQQLQTVERVRLHIESDSSVFNGSWRHLNTRKRVHGTLNRITFDARYRVEQMCY